jgi:hypothetical protein
MLDKEDSSDASTPPAPHTQNPKKEKEKKYSPI